MPAGVRRRGLPHDGWWEAVTWHYNSQITTRNYSYQAYRFNLYLYTYGTVHVYTHSKNKVGFQQYLI